MRAVVNIPLEPGRGATCDDIIRVVADLVAGPRGAFTVDLLPVPGSRRLDGVPR
jgi:hypothetical protein